MLLLLELKAFTVDEILKNKNAATFGVAKEGRLLSNESLLEKLALVDKEQILEVFVSANDANLSIEGGVKVGHAVVAAQRQATQYVEQLRAEKANLSINAFAVVLVGNRVVVRRADREPSDYHI